MEREDIADSEILSRLVFNPPMYKNSTLIWKLIFEFQNNQCESLIWHRHVGFSPAIAEVHACGCRREAEKIVKARDLGKVPATYVGAITATAGAIQAYQNPNGHGFVVVHEPSEGREHVHVCYRSAPDTMTRGDKNELKLKLGEIFSDLDPHSCPAHPASQ